MSTTDEREAAIRSLQAEVGRWRTILGTPEKGIEAIEELGRARALVARQVTTLAGVQRLADQLGVEGLAARNRMACRVSEEIRAVIDGAAP